jgi:hypothetical protein
MPSELQAENPSGSAASFVDQVLLQAVRRFLNIYLSLLEKLALLHSEQVSPESVLLVPRKIF